eukprot:4036908-Pyramimonas_sp.AAC.1
MGFLQNSYRIPIGIPEVRIGATLFLFDSVKLFAIPIGFLLGFVQGSYDSCKLPIGFLQESCRIHRVSMAFLSDS